MIKLNLLKKKKNNNLKKINYLINPKFYWRFVLFLICSMLLFSTLFGIYIYGESIADFNLSPENFVGYTEKVKKDRVENVLNLYSEKEKRVNDILENKEFLVDPSL